jgi:hypothetical protein
MVLSYLSVSQLLMLAVTSRQNYTLAKDQIRGRVEILLSKWSFPRDIFSFMESHNLVFSGSAILALLEPGCFRPNDLDAYVPHGTLGAVHDFLTHHTYYARTTKPPTEVQDATDGYVSDGSIDTGE